MRKELAALALSAAMLPAAALPAAAQTVAVDDTPAAILVLDASGSMWGQIDGVNKIVIAREVIGEMLDDFPSTQALGLTVYGHRRRGDCADIETVIEPGLGTVDAIREAVNSINPRGRTPMTDAVLEAARALRYTENAATVILVSDGIETCNANVCEIAAELEASGVGFTAHVIGFDVAGEPEARAQMQCIAENTGGQFLTAENAEELADALQQVAVAPAPPPPPPMAEITFTARIGSETGALIADPVLWEIRPAPEGAGASEQGNQLVFGMEQGSYDVTAYWTVQEVEESTQFIVSGEPREITLVFEEPMPQASLVAPAEAVAGSTIEVGWTGPDERNDFIATALVGERVYATNEQVAEGNPVALRVPSQPGDYELRYYLAQGRQVLASQPLRVTPATATLIAPDTAQAGATIEVGWTGPNYGPDFIAVAEPGSRTHINYELTREGSPVQLQMPAEPGTYEIRYSMQQDREVIATRMIEVTDVLSTLVAPDTAAAGSTIEVGWTGPDYQNDFISVAEPDDERGYVNIAYTRDGSPLDLVMPTEPGSYEIRYVVSQDRTVIATRMIEVTSVEASLVAPDTAAAGSTIEVGWTGPDYQNDFISVAEPDDERGYVNIAYTRDGSPLDLVMPTEPGSYEIRYVVSQDRTVIATRMIEVTSVEASLDAPASAIAGSTIRLRWTGPDYQNDFISVAEPDDERGYVNIAYTRDGSPLDLVMPTEPGSYEIRYVVSQDRTVIATRMIEVTSVEASLVAPDTAVAGSTIEVGWTGPDYQNDFISVAEPDDERGYVNYSYTRDGSPADLVMPTEPGSYEIRYVLSQDREVIAVRPITVTSITASLQAPATAPVGATIEVTWTGPDYQNDFISIGRADDERGYENYVYTRDGSPADLVMPSQPGDYEIRYVVSQDRTVVARVPVTVTELSGVTIDAPQSGVAGSTIQLRHTGPDYQNDFIAFGIPGDDRSYDRYAYTRDGNPLSIRLPDTPGTYELRYYMRQDNRILARRPFTVTAQ